MSTPENSPKIHFIKKDGKFYNSRNQSYESNIIHANYERETNGLKMLLTLDRFKGAEIHTITEHDFFELMASKTTTVILSGSYFREQLIELSLKLPTISQVGKTMYQKCKVAIESLAPISTMYEEGFIKHKEDETDEVRGLYAEYIAEAVKVQIYQCKEVTSLIRAYFIDRNSMMGMTVKILKMNEKKKQ